MVSHRSPGNHVSPPRSAVSPSRSAAPHRVASADHVAAERRTVPAARLARIAAVLLLTQTAAAGLPGPAQAEPRPSLAEVRQRVDTLHHEAEAATEEYNAATEAARAARQRLDQLTDRAARATARLNSARRDVGSHAAAEYRSGPLSPTLSLALHSDPDDFLERASHASRAADRTSLAIRELTAQQQGLEQVRADAKAETSALNTAREDARRAGAAVRKKLQQAEELLATLTAKERARVLAAEAAETADAAERADAGPGGAAAQRNAERPADPVPTSGNARAAQAIAFAQSQLGKPYGWGATGPDAYDCSGLTQAAWAAAGVALPRTSGAQAGAGTQVSRAELAPGDLVFYYSGLTHVALYIGNGQIVHAARSGTPVRVDPVDSMPFATATRPA